MYIAKNSVVFGNTVIKFKGKNFANQINNSYTTFTASQKFVTVYLTDGMCYMISSYVLHGYFPCTGRKLLVRLPPAWYAGYLLTVLNGQFNS